MLRYNDFIKKQEADCSKWDISVCITCFNQEKYIGTCLDSIIAQKCCDFRIVIGDDHSSDGSVNVIKSYVKKYPNKIISVFHESNIGVDRNRQKLFERCESKYIAFLDGDDYYTDEHCLEKKWKYLEEHREYIGFFSSGHNDNDGSISDTTDYDNYGGDDIGPFTLDDALHNNYPGLLDGFFIRNIYRYMESSDLITYNSISVDESSKLPILCGSIAPIFRSNDTTYAYRYVANSAERTKSNRNMCYELWSSHLELDRMVGLLFSKHMLFDNQMYDLAYNAFTQGIRSLLKGKTEDWNIFLSIWNHGYLAKKDIALYCIRNGVRRLL